MQFTDDGGLEADETPVETKLDDWGVDVDDRQRESRLDQPRASEFGVDNRPEARSRSAGEQKPLFPQTAEDQQALDGGSPLRFLFAATTTDEDTDTLSDEDVAASDERTSEGAR